VRIGKKTTGKNRLRKEPREEVRSQEVGGEGILLKRKKGREACTKRKKKKSSQPWGRGHMRKRNREG